MTNISDSARAMLALDSKLVEAERQVDQAMGRHMETLDALRAAVIQRDTVMALMRRIVETAQEELK